MEYGKLRTPLKAIGVAAKHKAKKVIPLDIQHEGIIFQDFAKVSQNI
jgi:hypothetical protein